MFLVHLHLYMFYFLVAAGTVCALWGLGLLIFRRQAKRISPAYRSALTVTGGMALIQAAIGGLLFLLGNRPSDQLHFVYGAVVLLAVPVAFVYISGKSEHVRRDLLYLVIAAIVVAAAAVRAYMTGQ
jgi:uncharacterized membrane protein